MILSCSCQHEVQDKLHGKGKRVFNPMGMQGKSGYRCSVCKSVNKSSVDKEEKKVEEVK
jgi:hypothetical protein